MFRSQPASHMQKGQGRAMEAASHTNGGLFAPGSFLEKLNSLVKGIGCPVPNVRRTQDKAFDRRWAGLPCLTLPPAVVPVAKSSPSFHSNGLPPIESLPESFQLEPATQPVSRARISSVRSQMAVHPLPARIALRQASSMAQEPLSPAALELPDGASDLDKQAQQLDAEISELIQQWELGPEVESSKDMTSSMLLKSKWCQADPMDLNDEFIQEDPTYDPARVESEALEAAMREDQVEREQEMPGSLVEPEPEACSSDHMGSSKSCLYASPRPLGQASARPHRRWPAGARVSPSSGKLKRKARFSTKAQSEQEVDSSFQRSPSEGRPFPCSQCARAFSSHDLLNKHQVSHADPRLLASHQPVPSQGEMLMKRQLCVEMPQLNQCQECSKTFLEPRAFKHHMQSHRQSLPEDGEGQASSSAVSPSSPSSPVQPCLESAPDRQSRYSLRPRGSAVEQSALEEDEQDTPGSATEESSTEEEGDASSSSMEESSAEEEELSPQRPRKQPPRGRTAPRVYPCPTCDKKFSNSSNMRKHLRIHTREAPYGCHVCGKSFIDSSNLTKHQRVHSGGVEHHFSCSKCPKAFVSAPELQEHLRHHAGVQPFPCMECKRSFVSQARLVAHIQTHVGRRRKRAQPQPMLRCEDCDKSFAGPRMLRQHQRRHKAFVCDECGAVFTLFFKFLFHKSQHKGPQTCAHCGVQYTGGHFCRAQPHVSQTGQGTSRNKDKGRALGLTSLMVRATSSVPALTRVSAMAGPPAPATATAGPPAPAPATARPPAPAAAPDPATARSPAPAPAPLAARPPVQVVARCHGSSPLMAPALPASRAPISIPLNIPASNPVTGVINNELILLNSSTLPPGTKIILQIPPQTLVPRRDAGVTARSANACVPQSPVLGRTPVPTPAPAPVERPGGEQQGELTRGTMPAEKGTEHHPPQVLSPMPPSSPAPSSPPLLDNPQLPTLSQAPPAALQPGPYSLRLSQRQVKYTEDGEGEGSDVGGSSGEDWEGAASAEEEEEEPVSPMKKRGRGRPAKKRGHGQPRMGPYVCVVCAKRFVYQRSLKQHMRLYRHYAACPQCLTAFSDPHKLERHMLSHRKEATA